MALATVPIVRFALRIHISVTGCWQPGLRYEIIKTHSAGLGARRRAHLLYLAS